MREDAVQSPLEWESDHRPASARFRVEIVDAPRANLVARMLGLVAWAIAFMGAGPTNPGGRQARIVDIATGALLATSSELLGDDGGQFGEVIEDLNRLDVAGFAARWIDSDEP